MRRVFYVVMAMVVGFIGAGCRVGSEYHPPSTKIPDRFHESSSLLPGELGGAGVDLKAWWRGFKDSELDERMSRVLEANHDIQLAGGRLKEAWASTRMARAPLFPIIDLGGEMGRSRLSENSLNGRQVKRAGEALENDFFGSGISVGWEIDVFGAVRRASEAARADFESIRELRRNVMVLVLAETGLAHVDFHSAKRLAQVARDHTKVQEETLAIVEDRLRSGLGSDFDVARARALWHSTRARVPAFEQQAQQAWHRLAMLEGKGAGQLTMSSDSRMERWNLYPVVPPGLPSALLERRPDIRRAERELAAASARAGRARSELFPRFFLTGAAGLQSVEAGDFFDGGSRYWSMGPSVRWPIFNAGRLRREVEVQDARHEQALIRYEQAVFKALEEVESGLVALGQEGEKNEALRRAEEESARAVKLALDRHRAGVASFLEVLDVQRSHLEAKAGLIESDHQMARNLIRFYKALGGGWDPVPTTTIHESSRR